MWHPKFHLICTHYKKVIIGLKIEKCLGGIRNFCVSATPGTGNYAKATMNDVKVWLLKHEGSL